MSKKIVCLLTACLLSFMSTMSLSIPAQAAESTAQTTETDAENADATGIYEISTADDLLLLSQICTLNTNSDDVTVVLTNDISLSGSEFVTIPYFNGTFDGAGHSITGFSISGKTQPAGLFARTGANAVIRDLTVNGNVQPTGTADIVGGIVGSNAGTVSNCAYIGVVVGNDYVGGIVGENLTGAQVTACTTSGSVRGKTYTGGTAGINDGSITLCESAALVNTQSTDPTLDVSDLDLDLTLDLSNFSTQTYTADTMDMGGICGYNTGVISLCLHDGTVGYSHTGYNVGGIAGRSCGYVTLCKNTGTVYGRKDVGGIVGQLEPYIEENLEDGQLSQLSQQISDMNAMVGTLQSDLSNAGTEITETVNSDVSDLAEAKGVTDAKNLSDSVSADVDKATGLTGDLQADVENAKSVASGIKTDVDNASNLPQDVKSDAQTAKDREQALSDQVSDSFSTLSDDISAVSSKLSQMQSTISSVQVSDLVSDTSTENPDQTTLGSVKFCDNTGTVNSDLCGGGVIGSMDQEDSVDPEDSLSDQLDKETIKSYEYKAVCYDNANHGTVSVSGDYAGAIVGQAKMGYITGCQAYGTVDSEGMYAGGIAGNSAITISGCLSKAHISADSYAGGIIGLGVTETASNNGSSVAFCKSMPVIEDVNQFVGAISGGEAGAFYMNTFVGDDLEGVNGYSLAGQAERTDFAGYNSDLTLPEEFRTLTLRFVADDTVLSEQTFDYGASFGADAFPEIPEKTGYFGKWDRTDLTDLTNDTTVSVVYTTYVSSTQSEAIRSNGRPVFFAQGDFADDQQLLCYKINSALDTEFMTEHNIVLGEDPSLTQNGEVEERWYIILPDDGSNEHELRFLPLNRNASSVKIYVKNNGEWERLDTESVGSYMTFQLTGDEAELAILDGVPAWRNDLLAGLIALVMIALVITAIVIRVRAARKRKREQLEEDRIDKGLRKVRRGALALVTVLGLIVGTVAIVILLFPSAVNRLIVSFDAANMLRDDSLQIAVTTTVTGDADYDSDALISYCKTGDHDVLAITQDGINLYYCDSCLYLENGCAFELSDLIPDYSGLLDRVSEIIQTTEIEAVSGTSGKVYQITIKGNDAKDIINVLEPDLADQISNIGNLDVNLSVSNFAVTKMEFRANVTLVDGSDMYITAVFDVLADADKTEIMVPTAVATAIDSDVEKLTITADHAKLIWAWGRFLSKDPNTAQIDLSATGSVLSVGDSLTWSRTKVGDTWVNCINNSGIQLYYTDQAACSANGTSLTEDQQGTVDSGSLIELAYRACLDGDFSIEENGESTTYTIVLDSDQMQSAALAIEPDLTTLSSLISGGSVTVTIAGGTITQITLQCEGQVETLLADIPVTLTADITPFANEDTQVVVPAAVRSTLVKED